MFEPGGTEPQRRIQLQLARHGQRQGQAGLTEVRTQTSHVQAGVWQSQALCGHQGALTELQRQLLLADVRQQWPVESYRPRLQAG